MILKQIIYSLVLVLIVSFISFIILYFIPGSVDTIRFGLEQRNETLASNNFLLICNEYLDWLKGLVLHNNWGISAQSHESVSAIILNRLIRTLILALLSIIFTISISILWAYILDQARDRIAYLSIQESTHQKQLLFWRLLIKIMKSIEFILLSFIPVSMALLVLGLVSMAQISLLNLGSYQLYILPLIVLVLLQLPLYTRSLMVSLEQVKSSKHIDFAHVLGLSTRWIWWREILPNAILFTLSLSIVQLSYLIGGTIIIERVFLFPGLGSKLIDAVLSRDKILVHGIIVSVSILVAGLNLVVSLIQSRYYGRDLRE